MNYSLLRSILFHILHQDRLTNFSNQTTSLFLRTFYSFIFFSLKYFDQKNIALGYLSKKSNSSYLIGPNTLLNNLPEERMPMKMSRYDQENLFSSLKDIFFEIEQFCVVNNLSQLPSTTPIIVNNNRAYTHSRIFAQQLSHPFPQDSSIQQNFDNLLNAYLDSLDLIKLMFFAKKSLMVIGGLSRITLKGVEIHLNHSQRLL